MLKPYAEVFAALGLTGTDFMGLSRDDFESDELDLSESDVDAIVAFKDSVSQWGSD